MSEKLYDIKDDFPELVKDINRLSEVLLKASISFHVNKARNEDSFSVLHWTGVLVQSYLQSMFYELHKMGEFIKENQKNDKYLNKILSLQDTISEVTREFCDFSGVFDDKKVH